MGAYINGKEIVLAAVKGEKGDPTSVVQTTGDKTESVMSQKAVTHALDTFGLRYRSYELGYGTFFGGNISNWTNTENRYRAVTYELIEVKAGMKIQFELNSVYKFGYAFHDKNKVYDGVDRGWLTKGVTIEEDGYIYLNFGKVDDSDLTEDNLETLKSICKIINNSIEDGLRENINEVERTLSEFGLYYKGYDIVRGSLRNGNVSINANELTRGVTAELVPVVAGTKIYFTDNGVYNFGYAVYDKEKVYDGIDRGWNKATATIENDGYIAMNFRRVDEGELTDEDFEAIKSICKVMKNSITDNSKEDIQNSVYIEYGRKNGASYVFARIPKTTNNGNTVTARLALTSADKSLTGLKVSPLAFAKRENTAFVLNAGLFDTTKMQPVGQTIINGEAVVSTPMEDDNGVAISATECYPLCIDEDGNLSAPYARSVTVETMLADGVKSAIVGWGKLVDNFEICEADIAAEIVHPSDYIRQSIGQFENGDYFVCTVEQSRGTVTNEAGMTYTELAELLIEKGAKFAYSLDGGGSAATVIGKRQLNRIYEGTQGRAVPTVIYFETK